jgi:hypothetical protein
MFNIEEYQYVDEADIRKYFIRNNIVNFAVHHFVVRKNFYIIGIVHYRTFNKTTSDWVAVCTGCEHCSELQIDLHYLFQAKTKNQLFRLLTDSNLKK